MSAPFGLSETGFRLKRLADIRADLYAALSTIEDPNTGETLQVDFDENDPFIQVINAFVDANSQTWEQLDAIIRQFDPLSATGVIQSSQVQLNGVLRRPGRPSTIDIQLTGAPGTIIEAGQRISDTQQNTIFVTVEGYTIGANGTVTGAARSENNGAFEALQGTVTTILTPVAGWNAVTNTADATLGQVEETDNELRARRDVSTETPSQSPVDAIFSGLIGTENVTYARVFVNNTQVVDARGIPGKSIAAVVLGGTDQAVAETLWLRSPAGMGFSGTTSFTITDRQGEPNQIRWIRPDERPVFISMDVTVTNPAIFGDEGPDAIRNAIVTYAQQGADALGTTRGFRTDGFVPGQTVNYSRLFTPINSVAGHVVSNLRIGLTETSLGVADIPIDYDELATFASDDIEINVVTQ